ncbi:MULTISPECIES: inner membrane protein YbjM [unclassified Pantoea]|uniref:inner membrane protein YbjM n=1 Tax=unclassified Pantoea TaxID=2630326 RepID=UPI00053416CB|nr:MULTISPECIES: inner membrane protein YbjM [unclassified Pantoea]MDU6388410.1 inner membrane protein YbjM [Pantoea sp.]
MPQRSLRWTSATLGVALYSLVFIYAHRYWLVGNAPLGGQPELLLFLLPGAVMALLHAESPLKSTLLMALWGTLLGVLLLNSTLLAHTSWLTLLVWSLSALFWAGSGALLVRLARIVWR